MTREWNELFHDIDLALNEDPLVAVAQGLAKRWQELVEEFTGGNGEIQEGLNAMYADTSHWPPRRGPAPDQARDSGLPPPSEESPANHLSHWCSSTCYALLSRAHSAC